MDWWHDALELWTKAFGIEWTLVEWPHNAPDVPRFGWCNRDETWLLRLDDGRAIRFPNWDASEEVRCALAWTLRQLAHEQRFGGGRPVGQAYAGCRDMTFAELTAVVAGVDGRGEPRDWGPLAQKKFPGYLIAIEWTAKHANSERQVAEDADIARHVIEAMFGHGWTEFDANGPCLLVFLAEDDLAGIECDGDEPACAGDQSFVKLLAIAEQLAAAVRAEAFVDAKVWVSMPVVSPHMVFSALASLQLTARMGDRHNRTHGVFGEDPALYLLSVAGAAQWKVLQAMLTARAVQPLRDWPDGWRELTEAMIKANLNASEAARSLYVHRNTLLARIERLCEASGFDVRRGEDAIALYLAARFMPQQVAST
ncbi:PucR C-terminal helix-turn-helix domain-containing protein [Alicyclobacillus hesperidum]|uniref:PucR C-terminal helix-turn-helix domain-containing protein n=1 Tax=Alicyclobacillus hesperidum TaxID=89784 RepID=A0A1H2Q4Q9_9BACL|nr:helix-turn-helix domain-containing protein [Alicyclobacillus hesperidum]SDW02157.1 PucR C-terminal helix-turn-helix domain-containing protein [Alicyclobacillus hesperidum]